MSASLVLLHEEALRMTHPVFSAAPLNTKAIFVWDDTYFKKMSYTLKRLVFIYETLLEMPIDIYQGETLSVIKTIGPTEVFVPASANPEIARVMKEISLLTKVEIVSDEPFVKLKNQTDLKRFFQYWKTAQKTAFLKNGGFS